LNRDHCLAQLKVGDYLRWKPLPANSIDGFPPVFENFVGLESEWQYAIVMEVMEVPRSPDPGFRRGVHLKVYKDGDYDWIFNFELFREIEIVGERKD